MIELTLSTLSILWQPLPAGVPIGWVLLAGFLLTALMTAIFAAMAWTEIRWQIEVQPWVPLWAPALLGLLLLFACMGSLLLLSLRADETPTVSAGAPPAGSVPATAPAVADAVGTAVAALLATTPAPRPTSTPTPVSFPASCAAIRQANAAAADGEYTLYLNGRVIYPIELYCHNMANKPAEYLTLPTSGGDANFALIAHPEGALITHYQKIRINPATLVVDVRDRTFATFAGEVPGYVTLQPEQVTDYPVAVSDYGRAEGCSRGRPGAPPGAANIDLRGTPFVLGETVRFAASGSDIQQPLIDVDPARQVVNLEVSGRCAQVQAVGTLRLAYVPPTRKEASGNSPPPSV